MNKRIAILCTALLLGFYGTWAADAFRISILGDSYSTFKHYKVDCLDLVNIDKQWGHPSQLGMQQIAEQIYTYLL